VRRGLRVAALASLATGALLVWRTGLLADFDLDALQGWVAAAGPGGPVAYLALFSLLQPFGLSAHVFLVAAGLLWPTAIGLPLGIVGLMGGAAVSFGFARQMGKAAVQDRIPEKLARHEQALADRGLRTVFLLRLAFFTFFPVSLAMGVSKVSWRDYLLGTLLGCLPMAVVDVVLAHEVAAWLAR
jgi:uncharacterized membrane protein YdjX (TVP38/TMEM64 family)